jgi:hypothetical protein
MLTTKDPACKFKLLGMVAFIFASGMMTGAFTWHVVGRRLLPPKPPVLSAEDKAAAMDHFARELELTEQQAQAVESILDEFIMEQADILARYRTSRTSGHDRLYQVLNEEQRKRLKKVLDELNTPQPH